MLTKRGWPIATVGLMLAAACGPSVTPTVSSTSTSTPAPPAPTAPAAPLPTESAFGPRTSPAVPCTAVDLSGPIPAIALVTPDVVHHAGEPYGSWAGRPVGPAGGDALIPSTATDAGAGQPLRIVVGSNACAVDWYIAYGALPPGGPAPWKFMPIAELVPTVSQNRDPAYASQNRFALAPLPPGDWLITVELGFLGGQEFVWFRVSVA